MNDGRSDDDEKHEEKYDSESDGDSNDNVQNVQNVKKTRGYDVPKRKLYCGNGDELPDGYDDFGVPSECLRKGVGVGMYLDKRKVAEMLANLFGIKHRELNDYKEVQQLLDKIKKHIKKYVDGKRIDVDSFGKLLGIERPNKVKILDKLTSLKF